MNNEPTPENLPEHMRKMTAYPGSLAAMEALDLGAVRIEKLEATLEAIDQFIFDLGRKWRSNQIVNLGPAFGRIHQMIRDDIGERSLLGGDTDD